MNEAITFVDYNDLLLDPLNPRLPTSVNRDPQSMLDYIAETTSIEELMDVIAKNGFFPGEPLVVVPHDSETGKYTVVEGNRRLTAVKLLQDPQACSKPGQKMIGIAEIAIHKPSKLPVVIRDTRQEVLPYLGYRHITGIKQWEPLAKARYIEQLFLNEQSASDIKSRYANVAHAIGSRPHYIKRSLDALAVYKVIEKHDFYEIEDLNEESIKFSVLSTALADEKIGYFVGLSDKDGAGDDDLHDPIENPGKLKKNEIKELTEWLFKKDPNGKTRVGESRNLRQLAAVVDNPRALAAFKNGSLLKVAYQLTSDLAEDFIQLLYQADNVLVEAASMVATIECREDFLHVIHRIVENSKLISRELKQKKNSDDEDF